MKLEPGKHYRQRNGGKAYVAAVDETRVPPQQAIGWTDDGAACCWTASGYHYVFLGAEKSDPLDLIAEWVDEPKPKRKVTMWVLAYGSEEEANREAPKYSRIVPITVEVDDDH